MNTTTEQKIARLKLLIRLSEYFVEISEKSTKQENWKNDSLLNALVPEVARAIHRIVCEPGLPKESQLFRREWEGRDVHK